jgi:multidrug efflux pump subunit AcrA (membrane-fusion protein)
MKKKRVIAVTGIILILLAIVFFKKRKPEEEVITCKVVKGPIEIKVHTSGQLEAETSENIVVPPELAGRNVRVYEIKITDLVEEGTVVDSGQFIATLDHKVIEEVLTQARLEQEQSLTALQDAKLDSNLTLSNFRDQLINSNADVEEKKITLAESVYESPSVIKKAQMDLEKAQRKLEQDKKGYVLKERQSKSRVDRMGLDLQQKDERIAELLKLYDALTIKAPKKGMVIYAKDRYGSKIQVGSSVSPWNPIIATLPDMTKMISKTYVNEIDISKIKNGQKAIMSIDAFPEKELKGEVYSVANIGQPMPKGDAKVFEVKIRINGYDPLLKPAMTTSNSITTGFYDNKLIVPSDAIFTNDSMKYVYVRKGDIIRQIVDLGSDNENFSIVNKGLSEGDELVLNEPEKPELVKTEGWEIYQEQKAKAELEKKKILEASKTAPPDSVLPLDTSEPVKKENMGRKRSFN